MLRFCSCSPCLPPVIWPHLRCLVHSSQLTLSTSMASGTSCCSKNMVALASTASFAKAECPAAVSTSAHQLKPATKPPRSITGAIRRAAVKMLLQGSKGRWDELHADTVVASAVCLCWLVGRNNEKHLPSTQWCLGGTVPDRGAASECCRHRIGMRCPALGSEGRHLPPSPLCRMHVQTQASALPPETLMRCWAQVQLCRWTCWRYQDCPWGPCKRDTAAPSAPMQSSLPRQCSKQPPFQ